MAEEFPVDVVVDPTRAQAGARQVEAALRSIENKADALRRTITGAVGALGSAIGVRSLLDLADAYTNLQNRIRTVTSSQSELEAVQERLISISNNNRQSVSAVVELYARASRAVVDLGKSQNQVLDFTEQLNRAILLSGASAGEAERGIIQLAQGLSLGALQGQDLKSVLQQIPTFGPIIAAQLKAPLGQVRNLGAQGKITAQVIFDAFEKAAAGMEKEFERTVPTIGQSLSVLRNNLISAFSEFDRQTGFTRALANSLLYLADNLDVVLRGVRALSTTLAINLARNAIGTVITYVRLLGTAILTNPLLALPALISAGIGALVAFGDQILVTESGFATVHDVALETFSVIGEALAQLGTVFEEVIGTFEPGFQLSFRGVVQLAATASDAIAGTFVGAYNAVLVVWDQLPQAFSALGELSVLAIRNLAEGAVDFVASAFQTLGQLVLNTATLIGRVIANSAAALGALSAGNLEASQALAEEATTSAALIVGEFASIPSKFRDNFQKLADQDLFPKPELTSQARDLGADIGKAFQQGLDSTTGARGLADRVFAGAEDRARARNQENAQRAREQEAARAGLNVVGKNTSLTPNQVALLKDIQGPMQEYQQKLEALRGLLEKGKISQDEYARAADNLALQGLKSANSLEAGFQRAFAKIRLEAKDLATVGENAFGALLNAGTDALTKLVETGKINFADLARSLISDLARIISRLLIVQALQAVIGGSGSSVVGAAVNTGGNALQARAGGGPVQSGRPYLVGEKGPEIVQFGASGSVTPADKTASALSAPEVKVAVVNSMDPNQLGNDIDSGRYDRVIINRIGANRNAVKRQLGVN